MDCFLMSAVVAPSRSITPAEPDLLLLLFCKAEVRFDDCGPRGEVDTWRALMSIGAAAAAPAMLQSGGDAPNSGNEWSSKSGSSSVESRQRLVVGLPTSSGRLNQGKLWSLLLRLGGPAPTGVTGVESLDVKRLLSLVAGE